MNSCLEIAGPKKNVYLKTYTVDQIQIQIRGLKFDQIKIQIRRIFIYICKYKYVFDPSPVRIFRDNSNENWMKGYFSYKKCIWKCRLQYVNDFVPEWVW